MNHTIAKFVDLIFKTNTVHFFNIRITLTQKEGSGRSEVIMHNKRAGNA